MSAPFSEKISNSGGNPRNVNPDGFIAVSVGEPINTKQIKSGIARTRTLTKGAGMQHRSRYNARTVEYDLS